MKEILLKIKAYLEDKASAALVALNRGVKGFCGSIGKAGQLIAGMGAMFGSLDSSAAKVAKSAGNVVAALAALGPIGGLIAGVNVVVGWVGDRLQKAADKAIELQRALGERVADALAKIKAAELKKVNDALDEATTKADRAAKAFETMAAATQKMHGGLDALDSATLAKDLAALGAKREAAANSPDKNTAERRVADVDVEIAERKYKAAVDQGAVAKLKAKESAENDAARLKAAEERVAKAEEAVAKAKEAVALSDVEDANLADLHRENLKNLERAEKALEDAKNAETAAYAAAADSKNRAKAAELEYAASVENARSEVEKATRIRREITERQKRDADEAARREEEEAERKRRAEEAALEKKEADEKIKAINEQSDERVKKLDEQIRDALKKATEWDRKAETARDSKGFGRWSADERKRENDEAKAERRRQNNLRNAIGRRDRLQEQIRLWGSSKDRESQLKRLNDFIEMQDPKNNPNLKNAEQLQRERDQVLKDTKKACEDILEQLKKATEL